MGRSLDADRFLKLLSEERPALDPLYLVSGDEPLLITEVADAVRAAASRLGFTERTSLVMDARSDWGAAIAATQNVSLFGDRRLVELQLPSGKPGKTGADTLGKLAAMAASGALADTLLLISLPRLDKATRSAKWAQALFDAATGIEIASIGRNQLPGWIAARLARQGQSLQRDSLEWMADKVEGNLLAAHQEIMKLGLLYPEGAISQEDLEKAVLNVARYDVFGLRDAMLAGHGDKALTMLAGLRAEGEALPLVLWAVGDEIRVLARLAEAQAKGGDLSAEIRRNRIFGNREQLARQALRRIPARAWPAAVQHAHDVDRLIKGLRAEGRLNDPWEELSRLVLRIAVAGKR
ncbi:DNA polymerase III subunit delta [Paracandidimonas soli]|uniref:DNA polymerase III subunit delta n=1 Tax=Paracandidimonas soli TaxID=1917182 RepID=A0A4R3VCK9_9BURK|nr:DNA polymerase III subunit delta [Paracandidimonas soli]TCV01299.1 DNA polymerase III delta subunit [Paracandidimonas soli]